VLTRAEGPRELVRGCVKRARFWGRGSYLDLVALAFSAAEAAVVVVGAAAVLGHIQSGLLLLGRDAQQSKHLKYKEQRTGLHHHPRRDNDDAGDLARKQVAAAARVEGAKLAVEVGLGRSRGWGAAGGGGGMNGEERANNRGCVNARTHSGEGGRTGGTGCERWA
jgi:hypothetical protein